MEQHFTDKTYHRYIRGQRDTVNLAGDFAWQMARALRLCAAAQPEAKAAPDLCYVIHWLEGGCDPLEAARELRAYQKQMGQAPAAALESKAAPAPATLSDEQQRQVKKCLEGGIQMGWITDTVAVEIGALLAAAGNCPRLDAEEGVEIPDQLIDSITKHGNYSEEATLILLGQLRQCIAPVGGSHV
jgi:hypothetical protein